MAGALGRAVGRALDSLEDLGPTGLGTLVAGAEDPLLPGSDAERPLVVVPALGPGHPSPWATALVAAADAVILLDVCEATDLDEALEQRLVVVAGLPAPPPTTEGRGLYQGDAAGPGLVAAWREHGSGGSEGPGVAWAGGRGASALAEALEAWAAGCAVVALPGTPRHALLREGGVLHAETVAEVVEATGYLLSNPPLVRVIGGRGRLLAARQPSAREVALRMLEGAEVARQSWAATP